VPHVAAKIAAALAVNCCVVPTVRLGLTGEIENVLVDGGPILSYPYTVYFGPELAVPWTVQYLPAGALAVKRPPAVMEPQAAVHVTGALAVNC